VEFCLVLWGFVDDDDDDDDDDDVGKQILLGA
jgi:hypothetical protein